MQLTSGTFSFSGRRFESYATVKEYTETQYKVCVMKCMNNPDKADRKYTEKGQGGNSAKLENNVCRTRTRIYELSCCNPWEYFCTLTLSPEYNRSDLKSFQKRLSQFVRDLNKGRTKKIKYLLIPETHKDGENWHMHGFLMGLSDTELHEFTLSERLPIQMRNKIKTGNLLYNWPEYAAKFGFCSLETIQNKEACDKYICKYITKELARCVAALGDHMYYCSQGLKRAQVICRDFPEKELTSPDYENDYVIVKVFRTVKEALQIFGKEVQELVFQHIPAGMAKEQTTDAGSVHLRGIRDLHMPSPCAVL